MLPRETQFLSSHFCCNWWRDQAHNCNVAVSTAAFPVCECLQAQDWVLRCVVPSRSSALSTVRWKTVLNGLLDSWMWTLQRGLAWPCLFPWRTVRLSVLGRCSIVLELNVCSYSRGSGRSRLVRHRRRRTPLLLSGLYLLSTPLDFSHSLWVMSLQSSGLKGISGSLDGDQKQGFDGWAKCFFILYMSLRMLLTAENNQQEISAIRSFQIHALKKKNNKLPSPISSHSYIFS